MVDWLIALLVACVTAVIVAVCGLFIAVCQVALEILIQRKEVEDDHE